MARSTIRYWNFLQVDNRLRGAIAHRIDVIGTGTTEIAEALNLEVYKIRDYLKGKTPNLNNFEIIKLANGLGIEVELSVRFRDDFNGAVCV